MEQIAEPAEIVGTTSVVRRELALPARPSNRSSWPESASRYRRLRALQLKQWKRGTTMKLLALGAKPSLTLRDKWRPTAVAGGVTAA